MKYFVCIFPLIFNLNLLFGQLDNTKFLYIGKTDSVTLAIYHYPNEELIEILTTESNHKPTDVFKLIKSKHFNPSDISLLNKKMLSKSSFKFARALPYHYNIAVNYYIKDTLVQDVEISTYTGNITIQRYGCNYVAPTYTDTPEEFERKISVTDTCLFRYKVSISFSKYFKKLLIDYDLWRYVEEVDKFTIADAAIPDR